MSIKQELMKILSCTVVVIPLLLLLIKFGLYYYNHLKKATYRKMNASTSNKDYDAKQHHYSPRREDKHLHLSEADRREFYKLAHAIPFNLLLFKYIDEAGMTDANVYKAAGISKQVFSYIRNNKLHSLKKENIVSICIVLKLDMEKTQMLLASCGYGLSKYVAFDKIISFCISNDCYDVDEINELLYEYDQPTICGTT